MQPDLDVDPYCITPVGVKTNDPVRVDDDRVLRGSLVKGGDQGCSRQKNPASVEFVYTECLATPAGNNRLLTSF